MLLYGPKEETSKVFTEMVQKALPTSKNTNKFDQTNIKNFQDEYSGSRLEPKAKGLRLKQTWNTRLRHGLKTNKRTKTI